MLVICGLMEYPPPFYNFLTVVGYMSAITIVFNNTVIIHLLFVKKCFVYFQFQVATTWEGYLMFSLVNNVVMISSINIWRWASVNCVPTGLLAPKAVSAISQVEEIGRNVPLAWSAPSPAWGYWPELGSDKGSLPCKTRLWVYCINSYWARYTGHKERLSRSAGISANSPFGGSSRLDSF